VLTTLALAIYVDLVRLAAPTPEDQVRFQRNPIGCHDYDKYRSDLPLGLAPNPGRKVHPFIA